LHSPILSNLFFIFIFLATLKPLSENFEVFEVACTDKGEAPIPAVLDVIKLAPRAGGAQ